MRYKDSRDAPMDVLIKRLEELSHAVTKGRDAINSEFYMTIPAQPHIDADIVISEAAYRLRLMKEIMDISDSNLYPKKG